MKLFPGVLALVFFFTQTVALAEGTKTTLKVATLASLATEEGVNTLIDQNLEAVKTAEASEQQELSKSGQRKEARWNKRLTQHLPKFNEKIAETYQEATDEQLDAQIVELKTNATHEGDVEQVAALEKIQFLSTAEKKTELTRISQAAVEKLVPTIAHDIGAAGGAVKYLLKAKKGNSNFGFTNKYAKIFCIILAVMLIFCAFGMPVILYTLFLGALIAVGVMSAFSPHEKGSYRFR